MSRMYLFFLSGMFYVMHFFLFLLLMYPSGRKCNERQSINMKIKRSLHIGQEWYIPGIRCQVTGTKHDIAMDSADRRNCGGS